MSVDLSPEERARIVAERAHVKYGPFASLHEAYGVLDEELHELGMATLHHNDCNDPSCDMPEFRIALHGNDSKEFAALASRLRESHIAKIGYLNEMIAECIDVIAVCDRIIAQWGEPS